jgi:lysophospholipid acyltransferase (LPLAT)-like uncharacterized protein
MSGYGRRLRFFLIERVLLPIAIVPVRLWIGSWRAAPADDAVMQHLFGVLPRMVVLTYHGLFFQLLAFCYVSRQFDRPFVVMLSPSLDGRLLGRLLSYFGLDCVYATTERRAVAGSREFSRRVERGDVGIVAVDGPRGPCGSFHAGALRLAASCDAEVALAVPHSDRGWTLPSWDRQFLPPPFARVTLHMTELPRQTAVDRRRAEETMASYARGIGTSVLGD